MSINTKLLAFALLFSACKPPHNPEVCLRNGTNHDINFWTYDGGHFRSVGDHYCSESGQGAYSWRADYPTKDNSTDLFAIWSGSFEVGDEDKNFYFTENEGTITYDFRDMMIGPYQFSCKTITLAGNDTLSVQLDTISGTLSKGSPITHLNLSIAPFYTGELVFSNDIYNFVGVGGGIGQKDPFKYIGFTIEQSSSGGTVVKKSCVGTKL